MINGQVRREQASEGQEGLIPPLWGAAMVEGEGGMDVRGVDRQWVLREW